uniref:Uncharacterized protein n=1 Tax=Kalanchoe fedtschenkoi TaxID=63787 RepID=A0A7N1A271_KALFE
MENRKCSNSVTENTAGAVSFERVTETGSSNNNGFSYCTQNQVGECAVAVTSLQEQEVHAISISLPEGQFRSHKVATFEREITRKCNLYSLSMPKGWVSTVDSNYLNHQSRSVDKRFDSFRTWSGRFEKQTHHPSTQGKSKENVTGDDDKGIIQNLSADRYYDALEGPELETLKDSEELVLPEDQLWPFLLRFPISSFGICLGISSQAILWRAIATGVSMKFLRISMTVNLILWCISVCLVVLVSAAYALKVMLYFEAVRREYYHPVRVNFFFAPWIAFLFLALGVPPAVASSLCPALWYALMAPIFCLELKIYGEWMSGGQRRLSKVANPSTHLSIVGNFVGALLGASMGLKEGPIFFFAVGLAHYAVLFVTLYQRLPTNETLPKELHPIFFLFVAAPSVACVAWANLQGSFDCVSRIAYFIALFLYVSLAVRVNFFRGFRFSLAWWAYTFPMTSASIATIKYSNEVTNIITQYLSMVLSTIATLAVSVLFYKTLVHAAVLQDLFPNDNAIAISNRRRRSSRKWSRIQSPDPDGAQLGSKLAKFASHGVDIEALSSNLRT